MEKSECASKAESCKPGNIVSPAVDVAFDQDRSLHLLMIDLPGADEASIDVKLFDGELTVTASTDGLLPKGELWAFEAPAYGYRRTFRLPDDVDVDGITAAYDAGVLSLEIPKRAEAQPRKIPVRFSH